MKKKKSDKVLTKIDTQIEASVLDKIDRNILNLLQADNQITNLELASKVGLSAPPCLRRVRRLREEGYIVRDVSLVDPLKVGQNLIIFVSITLENKERTY